MRRRVLHDLPCVVCLGWVTLLGGCGGDQGLQRAIVSGKVAYKGEPVADGMIRFRPSGGSRAPSSGAFIVNGEYRANGHGGVPIGTFKVEIEGYRPVADSETVKEPEVEDLGDPRIQYLPEQYNKKTQFEVTIEPGCRRLARDFLLTD